MKRPYSHLSISPIDLKLRTTCSFKANSIMWNDFWTGFILMITQYSFIHRLKSWEQYRKQIAVINYWKYCWGVFTRINLNIIRKGGFCAQTQKLITHCICCPCENLGMEQVSKQDLWLPWNVCVGLRNFGANILKSSREFSIPQFLYS